jgi:solute carrier family 25 citrate transporter 1
MSKKDATAEVKTAAYAIGGIVEAVSLQPVDTIKTRMQLDTTGANRSFFGTGARIVQQEGAKALWKGLLPFTGHLLFKNICRMGTYATLQQAFRDENGELGTARQMGAGLCAGMIEAVLVVTPFELVKTRLQEQKGAVSSYKYKGTIHATKTIVAEEGVRGLWKGISPTMVRNGVNQMVLFFAKDNADKILWNKQVVQFSLLHLDIFFPICIPP